ncbi:HAMP domain-containing sensor histidine kinase [Bernardetia sp. ABR2-2B]|uniref:sensor histidine kinase n=1 Tax=Bernardetia sp. ABR2-2B TaxID=3127472 RepID=UPI0030D0C68C
MENTVQAFLKNEHLQRSKNITYLVYFLFISMTLSFLPDIYLGLWDNLWYWFIIVFYLSSVIIIKKYFGTEYSAHWFLIGFNLTVFYFSSAIGRNSNLHLLFFVIILLIPSVLNVRSKRYVIFHTILPLLLVLILVLLDFNIFPRYAQINPYYENIFGKVNMILLFIVLPVVVWILVRSYQNIFNQLLESEKVLINKNTELSKTNKELDNFVYSVSHDLRAPISSVLGLIAISKLEKDPQQLIHYENLKEKSLLKLDSFIKDILDFSRNSRIEIKPQKINWQDYLTELTKEFEYLPEAKDIEVEINIKQEVDFYADKYRTGIVFNNIISNAFRYSDKQKEFRFIKIFGNTYKEKVCITIQDNGIGIKEEHQKKIFDMFYRASEDSKGSGLGLYILKETLEKINGWVKVESEVGKGSLFYIEIPNLK